MSNNEQITCASASQVTIAVRPAFTVTVVHPESDSDYEVEPNFDFGPLPRNGWNNAVDVAEAKRRCQDMAYCPLDNAWGREVIFNLAMDLRDLGISKALAVGLIDTYCTSPLTKGDVNEQVHHAYLAARIEPGLESSVGRVSAANAAVIGGSLDDAWREASEGDPPTVWPKPLVYQGKDNASKSAETFLAERPGKLISSDGALYTLEDNCVWRVLEDDELAAEIRATDPTNVLDVGKIFLMVKAIHLARFVKARPFEWIDKPIDAPEPTELVLATNGILDARTLALAPHTGRYFATGVPVWEYDPDATCPLWLGKLDEWLHPSFHATLQEFMGYLLTSDTSIEVLLAMMGAKRGGKGTITKVMQALVGKHHHASVTLNDLGSDFGLAGLMDKRAVFIPDAHDAKHPAAAIERIKSITGNDELSVNRKNQAMLSARIPAKIVLVANKHPKFLDESGALADRELVLVFESSFAKVKDTELGNKLRAEWSGIANWALEGLRRLRANGNRFTIGERGRKAQQELAEAQSPALRFAKDYLVVTGDEADAVPLAVVYRTYEHWAIHEEGMSGREQRNKTDFKADLIAALGERGVRFHPKMARRWRDPRVETKHGKGAAVRRWFTGGD
ncbi:phage/plasmid primase, P4 family (plasmid) [Bradyrhizobium barranii subsp. barranii]|uniref:Phage/plasmid primase, P4 family n=1 Tax=Bradyrhizobium barranii subsp. barranii TaxID=2823807 RepID=A0A7Z0QP85_9BRAD|nr:DNA primase family protein [Bradyrhizobium barranii]UGX89848.1 phage/plasmid primase, P4 family [Bradyrhizobium barranii subsp. barranii]